MWRLIIQIIVKSAAVGIVVMNSPCREFSVNLWWTKLILHLVSGAKMAWPLVFGWALKNSSSLYYVWLDHSFHSYYSFTPLPSVSMATGMAAYRISRDSALLPFPVKEEKYSCSWDSLSPCCSIFLQLLIQMQNWASGQMWSSSIMSHWKQEE